MQEAEIFWKNAQHLRVDLTQYYLLFGREVAKKIAKKNRTYSIICGLEGNGADGLAIAGLLIEQDVRRINIYITGRVKNSDHPIFQFLFKNLSEIEDERLIIKQDCFAEDIEQSDYIVECMAGTGLSGTKLNKRYLDIVKRFSHFYSKKIAIDLPVFHYTPDTTYSLIYPKVDNAITVNIKIPENIELFCGPAELSALSKPSTTSHKNKNGKLLILDMENSLDIKLLSKIRSEYPIEIDIFSMNRKPLRKSAINYILAEDLEEKLESCNSILVESIDTNFLTIALVEKIFTKYSNKKYVFSNSVFEKIQDHLSKIQNKVVIFDRNNAKFSNRRFIKENNLHVLFFGVSTVLFSPYMDMRKVIGIQSNPKDLLYKTALYSTQNNLWLSLRASLG